MRKQAVTFEWQELDENQELPPIVETSASRPAANLWRQGSRLIASGGALWPALHEHADWETLIPAVFGVTMDEFEASWQGYLGRFREAGMHASLPPES